MRSEDIIKACDSLEELFKMQNKLGKDALIFIAEKGLWNEFIKFQIEKDLKIKLQP